LIRKQKPLLLLLLLLLLLCLGLIWRWRHNNTTHTLIKTFVLNTEHQYRVALCTQPEAWLKLGDDPVINSEKEPPYSVSDRREEKEGAHPLSFLVLLCAHSIKENTDNMYPIVSYPTKITWAFSACLSFLFLLLHSFYDIREYIYSCV